jgi:hypothetical protein
MSIGGTVGLDYQQDESIQSDRYGQSEENQVVSVGRESGLIACTLG